MSYNTAFFEDLALGAEKSAEIMVPIVYEKLKPKSVLDVGCGLGSWLKIWQKNGVDIYGIDGDWIDTEKLSIPKESFEHIDLERNFYLGKKFELVISLEVAEHLHKESAQGFVQSLVKHSDVILFSAAIPWQGGTDHYNEQWPIYWIGLFEKEGYRFLDPFRHIIWNEKNIKHHYRQNTILFVKDEIIKTNSFFTTELEYAKRSLISVVHPEKYIRARDPQHRSIKQEIPEFLQLVKNFVLKLVRIR